MGLDYERKATEDEIEAMSLEGLRDFSDVLVNEVLARPAQDEVDAVELFNGSADSVDRSLQSEAAAQAG